MVVGREGVILFYSILSMVGSDSMVLFGEGGEL